MSTSTHMSLRLKKGADRRLRAGHLWVYSNEVDIVATPLKTMSVGSEVAVEDASGKFVAMATVNPASLICARLYTKEKGIIYLNLQIILVPML